MKEIVRYRHCFVCGEDNDHGLKAKFFEKDNQAISSIVARQVFEGYEGIYHGGIIATMLDEVMIKAILARGVYVVTAEMTIRFHKPVMTGQQLDFIGRVAEDKGRLFITEGKAVGPEGTVFASASGRYVRADSRLKEKLEESIEPE